MPQILRSWLSDRLSSRRSFLTSSVALTAASVVASGRASRTSAAFQIAEDFAAADIDWQRAAGSAIEVMSMHHAWMHQILPLLPQFTELTGIEVLVQVQSNERYTADLQLALQERKSKPDAFMCWSYPEAVRNGWLEPLDGYLDNPDLCDLAWYDLDDLVPSARTIATWNDQQCYGFPVTAEAETLFMNRQLASTIKAGPPSTFEDLQKLAVSLKSGPVAGIAMRARPSDNASPWPAAGFVFSYGGKILSDEGVVVLDSPEAVEAIDMYGRLLRDAGPPNVGDYDWLECLNDFMAARTAIGCDSSNFAPDIANPDRSLVAGQVYYGLMPSAGPNPPKANIWHWLVGMNANSDHKEATWLFLQWANSKPTLMQMARHGMSTPRISAWQSMGFQKAFGEQAATAALGNLMSADVALMKSAWFHPKAGQILTPFAVGINEVATGKKDAMTAMVEATSKANAAILV